MNTPETLEAGYAAVRRLIHHQAHRFCKQYGGDLEDVIGDAHLLFMRGHANHTRAEAGNYTYATRIRLCVWYGLFDAMRKQVQRRSKVSFTPINDEALRVVAPREFSMCVFESGVSGDAAFAARLAIHPTPELKRMFAARGGEPRNMRSCIREHLLARGWPQERIRAAFEELAETC